jgi:hypothetical protein
MSSLLRKHLELEIKTLQIAPSCRQVGTAFTSKAKTIGRAYQLEDTQN